jgi:hypothetical protein
MRSAHRHSTRRVRKSLQTSGSPRNLSSRNGLQTLPDLFLLPSQNVLEHAQSALATLHALDNIGQTELGIGPERLDDLCVLHADADEAAFTCPVRSTLDVKLLPHALERFDEVVTEDLVVAWGRGDTQTLLADGNSRVVDGLDVDLVLLEEEIGGALSDLRVTDEDRDDVRRVGDDWDVTVGESGLDGAGVKLLQATVACVYHLVLDGGLGTSHGRRWERCSEDEARCERANGVDQLGGAGNVAAHAAISLAQSTSDNVDALHDRALGVATVGVNVVIQVLGDTSTVGAVHADSMDFIEESQGAVLVSKVTDLLNGTNAAAHAVDTLKSDDLGRFSRQRSELVLQVDHIVVLEDHLLRARVSNALDHRGVVHAVTQDHAVREFAAQSCQSGIVGDVARREDQSTLLRVQLCDRLLKTNSMLVVTRNVPSATSASTVHVQSLVHLVQDFRVLSHSEVIVRAPHRNLLFLGSHVGLREFLRKTVDVVEVAVTLVLVLLVQLVLVEGLVIEASSLGRRRRDTVRVLLRIGRVDRLLSSGLRGVGLSSGAWLFNSLSLVGTSSVEVGPRDTGRVGPRATKGTGKSIVAQTGRLDRQGLAHDRAATGDDLEVAHGTATRRSVLDIGAGGHGPQSCGRGLVQKGTHGPGLTEECLHVGWREQRETD